MNEKPAGERRRAFHVDYHADETPAEIVKR
jgi:hypothetical protein